MSFISSPAFISSVNSVGSTCVQEHGQVHQPPGHCAALRGSLSTRAPTVTKNVIRRGFKMCHLIFLSAGSSCAEARDNPLEKESGALHGFKPGTFKFVTAEVANRYLCTSIDVLIQCHYSGKVKKYRVRN